jgi:hypothetical protein
MNSKGSKLILPSETMSTEVLVHRGARVRSFRAASIPLLHKRIVRLTIDIRNTSGVSLSCHRIGIDPVVHHCWSDRLFSSGQPVEPRLSHG